MTTAPHLVHLAIAQFKPRKADFAGNLARLRTLFAEVDALDPRPALLCLPETALTGYFLEGGVREVAETAGALARQLDEAYRAMVSAPRTLDVCIGFYEVWRNRLFNSALYVTVGGDGPRIRHVHRKVFLPTYGLFDEERFVERGRDVRAFATPWGRAAMLVCEDAWHSLTGTIAALDGAQLIIVPTAPPARGPWPKQDGVPGPASASRWERLARDMAEEHGVFVVLANLVGSEGGKLFPGGSMVAGPAGDVRARGPAWDEALVTCTVDLRDVTRARADMPLVADLETMLPHLVASLERVDRGEGGSVAYDDEGRGASGVGRGEDASIRPAESPHAPRPTPHTPGPRFPVHRADNLGAACPHPLEIDPELTTEWLVRFIREEMERRGFARAVVGISGGVDSAVTAYLAARALGPEQVHGIRMPYRTSSPDSLAHGQLVIDALGIQGRTVDISAAVDGYLAHEPDADGTRRGNVMARLRMITLFDLSSKYRAIPLGTGNKTERLFGYFTWHADDSPPINPLGDLFKTQVWELARHLGVPEVIVGKPPSADLVVGQTDESDFGISYAKADEILNWLLSGVGPEQLVERGLDRDEIALVMRRLATTHWKRRLPTVALMSPTAIGESYLRPVDY
ncbi:MAG TPA: NAD+ synthase [Gemmatimonadaceae bacterium]|nr:NAD+ synthase [Gemmatimonadaceae bacterium]